MDDNANQEQDFSKLSIEDRVNHKNWKARVSGYEELAKLFPQYEDKEFNKFAPLVKKFVIDSNAAAQEKGLAATLAFVDYCPTAGKYVENIVTGIATKCLTATRAKTKELANDIVLMCVEIEKQDIVVEELIKAFDQKTPKNVAATIAMLRKCLNQFGYKVINVKPIVPNLARLLEERDPNVREEAKQLTIEIYRWIKNALVPQLSALKPILLQELESEFEKHKDSKAQPLRLLRSQQQREEVTEETDGACETVPAGDDGGEVETEMDPFDLMEPVDILTKLPADFYTLLEAKKWSERKDGLEKLQQLLEANPKLASNADYSDLVKQLRKIISKDTNIVVVTFSIKCLSLLANGLRKNFHTHANSSMPVLLEKFKEKKANVVQALREATDAIYVSTTIEAISEDLVAALDNKNPSIRSETALFLARSFAKTNPNLVNKKLLKTLTTSLLKTLSDSDAVVRESSAEALGTALKAQGERNMGPFLQGLEPLKMSKIEESCAKAEVKKFANVQPAQPKPAPKPKTAVVKRPVTGLNKSSNNNISSESLNSDFGQPTTVPVKTKSKVGVQSKTRTGASSSGSESSKQASTIRAPTKTSTARLATSNKGSTHSTNLPNVVSNPLSTKKQEESGPLMNGNCKLKEQRFADERALKVLKWNFTTPREEFYQLLREQMTNAEWQPQLITYCFHSDFKYHIKAIDMMREFFLNSTSNENVEANLDLVLKWIALRFFDTNPSVITKALELLLVVFKLCGQHQYTMNDIEANSFIPYLVLKVGDPKDAVRNKVHDILSKMRNIYPANKIFSHLFTGLQSKNARQRATCLEEISQLIELQGMSIFQPPNSIQLIKDIAKFLAERDNAVRNGALSCIVQVYFREGEKVFKLIGSLSDKEMSLVEERIKRASKNRPAINQNQSAIPDLEASNASSPSNSNTGSASALPTLSCGNSRLPTTPQVSRLSTPSEMEIQRITNPQQQQQLDNNATFSKSRSASSLMKRNIYTTPLRPSGSIQLQQQQKSIKSNNYTSDDTESDENPNFHRAHLNNFGSNQKVNCSQLDTQDEVSSDCYSATDDEAFNQRVMKALNYPEIKLDIKYRDLSRRLNMNSDSNINNHSKNRSFNNSPIKIDPEISQKFATLFLQLSSSDIQTAIQAMERLNVSLKEYKKYNDYLESKIDQIIILCNKQYRLFLSQHFPNACDLGEPGKKEIAINLYRCTSSVLSTLFQTPLAKKISRDTLRELLTHLLTYFTEMRNEKIIFNNVNILMGFVLNGADATNLFAALIRMLHDYVGNYNNTQQPNQFLDITMRFIWRITKIIDNYINDLNIDQIVFESHLFFKSYPRNWWKINNRDDMPLRTIKTLVYHFVERLGDSMLDHFTLTTNKDDSELWYYVQKALRQCEKSGSTDAKTKTVTTVTNTVNNSIGNNSSNNNNNSSMVTARTNLKSFPLKVRKINTENGETTNIPMIENDNDLKIYIDYTAKQLNIPELNYDMIVSNAKPIETIQGAADAVHRAKERLNRFKSFVETEP